MILGYVLDVDKPKSMKPDADSDKLKNGLKKEVEESPYNSIHQVQVINPNLIATQVDSSEIYIYIYIENKPRQSLPRSFS